jgi:hypothetical protein
VVNQLFLRGFIMQSEAIEDNHQQFVEFKTALQNGLISTPSRIKSNTVFNQVERGKLTKQEHEAVSLAVVAMGSAREQLIAALSLLEEFKHLSKVELMNALRFTDANIYMLTELVEQNKLARQAVRHG